jgi:mitochondrial fission protein ELM1
LSDNRILVWCLLGKKAGDNTQVRALAHALGYETVEKFIKARPWELLSHLGSGVTLAGIDRSQSSALQAPWPDIVISAGRRNEPVARWIQRQSGNSARLVHIGRPWAPLDTWDLVVTTPQYFLPKQANILHNSLPLHRVSGDDFESISAQLQPQLAHLPRPWIAVLMGGDSGRFVMTRSKGQRLGRLVQNFAAACDGSLLVTDSARTPEATGDAMQAQLLEPNFCYRWGSGGDNPYRGLLALADAFVVTGESMSMLSEAVDTGRPLYIFDVADEDARWWLQPHNFGYKPVTTRIATRFGPRRMRRDVGNIQNELVASSKAQWLTPDAIPIAAPLLQSRIHQSHAEIAATGSSVAEQELQRAAQAVRQLVTLH